MSNLSNSPNQKTLQLHIHAEHRGSLQQSLSHLGYSLRCHMTFIRTSQTSAVAAKRRPQRKRWCHRHPSLFWFEVGTNRDGSPHRTSESFTEVGEDVRQLLGLTGSDRQHTEVGWFWKKNFQEETLAKVHNGRKFRTSWDKSILPSKCNWKDVSINQTIASSTEVRNGTHRLTEWLQILLGCQLNQTRGNHVHGIYKPSEPWWNSLGRFVSFAMFCGAGNIKDAPIHIPMFFFDVSFLGGK